VVGRPRRPGLVEGLRPGQVLVQLQWLRGACVGSSGGGGSVVVDGRRRRKRCGTALGPAALFGLIGRDSRIRRRRCRHPRHEPRGQVAQHSGGSAEGGHRKGVFSERGGGGGSGGNGQR